MTGPEPAETEPAETEPSEPTDDAALRESDPSAGSPERLAGGMGVSSETVGPTGPGQLATDGVRLTTPPPADDDHPPEQSAGGAEDNPEGLDADQLQDDPRPS